MTHALVQQEITNTLKELGITPAIRGFGYLRDSILYIVDKGTLSIAVTQELYPEIAKKYSVKWTNIERCIRHAIHIMWGDKKKNPEAIKKIFNCMPECPTNGEFLMTMVDYIHQKYNILYNEER